MTRILAFAGSARRESVNKQLARLAADRARDLGAEVTYVDLRDLPLPLYDGDLEAQEGVPGNARKLRGLMQEHDGLLISCPEYNSSITPLLKNTIDWTSRPDGDDKALVAFRGKTAGLVAASPGALGGLRGLVHVRAILSNLGVLVIPTQLALSGAHQAFHDDGGLRDERVDARLTALVGELVDTTARMKR